jgi:hypothetical protein
MSALTMTTLPEVTTPAVEEDTKETTAAEDDGSSSSDSGSSSSSGSDSESDDDQDDGFTKEQREAIASRLAALRGNFKKAEEKSIDQKVVELMNSVQALTKEQALMAIHVCNNNEFEAAERLDTEPGFRESIANMVIGHQPKRKRTRVARVPSARNTITQVQVNAEGGDVQRRNISGKGANIKMPNAVIFSNVPQEVTDDGLKKFCEKYGKINVLEMQRVRLRAVCSFMEEKFADKLLKDHDDGVATVDGFEISVKKKVKKNNRVGRVLLDDALKQLAAMEKNGGFAPPSSSSSSSSSTSSSKTSPGTTKSKKKKKRTPAKKKNSSNDAEYVTVGSVIDVKTRDSEKERLKWHRAQVLRVESRGKIRTRLVAVVVYTESGNRDEYDVELNRKDSIWRLLSGGKTDEQVQKEREERGELIDESVDKSPPSSLILLITINPPPPPPPQLLLPPPPPPLLLLPLLLPNLKLLSSKKVRNVLLE